MIDNNKLKSLGKNIAKYRKERHMSQNAFSKELGISREHLAKIETAKRGISMKLLFKLCDILGITESELFKF